MRKVVFVLLLVMVLSLVGCKKAPTIHVGLNPGVDTTEINKQWSDTGAYLTVEDVYLTGFSEDAVDTSTLGEYEVTYSILHDDIEYSIIRMVQVVDQTSPILSILEGIDTIAVNAVWVDGGCEVMDNSGETLVCSTDSVVDTSTVGVYEVLYTAEDSSGNEGTIIRIVTVVN
jgi:hypothetical protein